MDVHGVRRQLLDGFHGVVENGQVVAGVERHPEILAAVLLQQRDLLIDAPVLVVFDAERHPVLFHDRHRRGNLAVKAGDCLRPGLRRLEHLVAPPEQAHDAQARGTRFLRNPHCLVEDADILTRTRQEGLDLDVHAELLLQTPCLPRPVHVDARHPAVCPGGAHLHCKEQQAIGLEEPMRRAEANGLKRVRGEPHRGAWRRRGPR